MQGAFSLSEQIATISRSLKRGLVSMSSGEDTVGCVVLAVGLAFGAYWLYGKYEIKARSEQIALPQVESSSNPRDILPPRTHVASTESGTLYYLDNASVKGPRSARVGWVILDHTRDKEQAARTSRELIWTNCDTEEVKSLSLIQYDKDGAILHSEDHPADEASVTYYLPGTIGAGAPSEMCSSVFDRPPSD